MLMASSIVILDEGNSNFRLALLSRAFVISSLRCFPRICFGLDKSYNRWHALMFLLLSGDDDEESEDDKEREEVEMEDAEVPIDLRRKEYLVANSSFFGSGLERSFRSRSLALRSKAWRYKRRPAFSVVDDEESEDDKEREEVEMEDAEVPIDLRRKEYLVANSSFFRFGFRTFFPFQKSSVAFQGLAVQTTTCFFRRGELFLLQELLAFCCFLIDNICWDILFPM